LCVQVPGYPELRKRLLRLAPRHVVLCLFRPSLAGFFVLLSCFSTLKNPVLFVRVANLPEEVKKGLEDPNSRSYLTFS